MGSSCCGGISSRRSSNGKAVGQIGSARAAVRAAGVGADNSPGRPRAIKVTTVGDGMVGKTCMLITYMSKKFPHEYVPTVFDNYADVLNVDGQDFSLTLWDTAGQEDYERLRPLSYPNTDCFLLCFSVENHSSFENVLSKWFPEIRHHCPNVPIVLVATKTDLRDSEAECVTTEEGRKMRKKIGASCYMECSAKANEGVYEVIVGAVRAVVKKPMSLRRRLFCSFL